MKINAIEIINVLIVVFLFFILKRKRDVTTLLLVLFVYGTLHFSYSVVALGANDVTKLLVLLHIEGSGVLATLSTLILLGVSSVLLSRRAYGAFVVSSREERQIAINILLIMAVILGGYIFNTRPDDWLQLKNVISIEVMLALLLIGFFGLIGSRAVHVEAFYSWGVGGLFILGFSNLISLYEVLSKDSWAGTLESSGAMVYRASSILFNPNLYGFWASLMYLGWAYGLHQYTSRWKMMVSGMILASVSIYLSGARSAGFLLLAVLILSSLLWKGRLHTCPCASRRSCCAKGCVR